MSEQHTEIRRGDLVEDEAGQVGIVRQARYVWNDPPTTRDENARGRFRLCLDVLWGNGLTQVNVSGDDVKRRTLPTSTSAANFAELLDRAERLTTEAQRAQKTSVHRGERGERGVDSPRLAGDR